MKKLFSFIMVGLAFTVLQVSISQAQVTAPGGDSEVKECRYVSGKRCMEEDKGWTDERKTYEKQRKTPGAKDCPYEAPVIWYPGYNPDEVKKDCEHNYNELDKQTKEQLVKKIADCVYNTHNDVDSIDVTRAWCTAGVTIK